MGLGSWLATGEWTPSEQPAVPHTEQRMFSVGDPATAALLGYTPIDGISVSEHTALNLSAVFRAVSLVTGAVAGLPLRTLDQQADGQVARVSSFLDDPGHPRYTPSEWAQLVMVHLLMHGNAYLQHIYAGAGQLIGLNPVHPGSVSTCWDDSRPGGKRFDVRIFEDPAAGSKRYEFDSSTMTQIMGPSLDGLVGVSALTAGRLSLGTGLAGEKAANRSYRNGAMISGLVTPKDPADELTPDQARETKAAINQTLVGPERAGDVVVMSQALTFTPWAMSAADAQFMESRTFSVDEIGRWFGVPPHLLGLTEKSTSWGQGIAEQNRGLARYTLTPWTTAIEQRLTTLLPPNRKAEFDYTAFVRPSPEDEIGLLLDQVREGLITPNEARRVRNMPPVAGGDTLRIPPGAAPPTAPGGPPADGSAP